MRQITSCGVSKWKQYQCNLLQLLKKYFGLTQSKGRAKRGQRSYLQGYNVDIVEDNVEVSLHIKKQNMTSTIYIFKNALVQYLKKATTMEL